MSISSMTKSEIREMLQRPTLEVFLDGRNEHGTHVLPMNYQNLFYFDDQVFPEIESQSTSLAETIFSDAERLGHKDGHVLITKWRIVNDEPPYMEYDGIDEQFTEILCGTPEEQEAGFKKAVIEAKALGFEFLFDPDQREPNQ